MKPTASALFALHVLLGFWVIFREKLSIPVALVPLGRMHPLLVHFPIVLLLLAGAFLLFFRERKNPEHHRLLGSLLTLTALSAVLSALMGLLLSQEDPKPPPLLVRHMWAGVGLSFLCYGLWAAHRQGSRRYVAAGLLPATGLLLLTGHWGASLTHGEDFLFPAASPPPPPPTAETPVFAAAIEPLLRNRCTSCHNPEKPKGGLVLTSRDGIQKGGKNGVLWKNPHQSLLVKRLLLPPDHKEHMPPRGKPQLTPQELALLQAWVNNGADFERSLQDLPAADSLRLLAAGYYAAPAVAAAPVYDFAAASEADLTAFNTPFRRATPLAAGSPGLHVRFFGRQQFKPDDLKDLSKISGQVVSLSLQNMPLKDADLSRLPSLPNLHKLNLNQTDLTGQTLKELLRFSQLQSVSLSGTRLQPDAVAVLAQLPALREVFLWNSGLSPQQQKALQARSRKIFFRDGYEPSPTDLLVLNPPLLANEEQVLTARTPVALRHPLPGVSIRYTTDGTEPDSGTSPLYTRPFLLPADATVKFRAIKAGWRASPVVAATLFQEKFHPDSVQLLAPPNPGYRGEGGRTLINRRTGSLADHATPQWLGYRENPCIAELFFGSSVPVRELTISTALKIGSFMLPPARLEVHDASGKLLASLVPPQPGVDGPAEHRSYRLPLPAGTYKALKVSVFPVRKLPSWHKAKGQPAWVFVDEIIVK